MKFHVVGLKCKNDECGGYNTTQTNKRSLPTKTTKSSNDSSKDNSKDDAGEGASSSAPKSSVA